MGLSVIKSHDELFYWKIGIDQLRGGCERIELGALWNLEYRL